VTLVVQGLSLGPLIRALKVGSDWSGEEELQRAKLALGKAAIAAIDARAAQEDISQDVANRIRAEFAEKVTLWLPGLLQRGDDPAKRLRRAALTAERQELIRLWRDNQISDAVLHHVEEDLDYQESRL
jgi:hypothetical protein